ncbi:hypothetical protein IFM89_022237 [Coptis chinensis]|uniref:Endonuclease/exonuclease/phosphatase domain-containing protein n=1 Tax=Coptis chinensis TaxID=261450 RepID=A0A835HRB9_9MAGN|nr:hypothetical protein IFM89_022237 [Coptis chinensis]
MSHQQITIKTGDLLISLVHARSPYVQRRALWEELSQLGLNAEAWAVAGDFNVVTSNVERKGGRLPCQTAVNEFVEFINGNALMDTTSLGFQFSWSNKRRGDRRMVQEALDKAREPQRGRETELGRMPQGRAHQKSYENTQKVEGSSKNMELGNFQGFEQKEKECDRGSGMDNERARGGSF